jgi:DNA polymerase III epsilon subunit
MRELVIDTETTGLDANDGHRIVEIAVLELMNHLPTGRFFHRYVNPDRDMPEAALAVHGLTREFLAKHPVFAAHADELLEFLGTDQLVIHNAEFDLAFLNMELKCVGHRPVRWSIRLRWRGSGSPASRPISMRSVGASPSISAAAKNTARESTASCSPQFISS